MSQPRRLYGLRIRLSPPPGKTGIWEFIASDRDCPDPACHPPTGKKWCDVVVGDIINDREGYTLTVQKVMIFRAHGGEDGDVIVSGRDWLATGHVIKPGRIISGGTRTG